MISHAPISTALSWRTSQLHQRIVAGLALVILADWLFYGRGIGISAMLFFAALCAFSVWTNGPRASPPIVKKAILVLGIALAPLVEDINKISFLLAAAGAAAFVLMISRQWEGAAAAKARSIVRLYAVGPWRFVTDLLRVRRIAAKRRITPSLFSRLTVWIVPLLFCAVFVMLFRSANPLIELWLSQIQLAALLGDFSFSRLALWLAVLCLTWPFLHVRGRGQVEPKPAVAQTEWLPPNLLATLLSRGAILRSLLIFNILFVAQTGSDALYLWGGLALPNGMSYADYAHRGAYPLIFTAILAGAFVLAALRPGSDSERSVVIRGLVYLWIAQNLLLVVSAILRLDIYVAAYSLTLLRSAAFIWMLLVAAGLSLLILRIALSRSNAWLVRVNLLTLLATLYACSLINFADVVASYDVAHCREISGQGPALDLSYIVELGPQAIPAMDRYLDQRVKSLGYMDFNSVALAGWRSRLAASSAASLRDWRAWTFRDARLWRYQERAPGPVTPVAQWRNDRAER